MDKFVPIFQFFHLEMEEISGYFVHFLVDAGMNQLVKAIYNLFLAVQFDSADFNDFEGDFFDFPFGTVALIPFQIKNDIIHRLLLPVKTATLLSFIINSPVISGAVVSSKKGS